MSDTGRTQYDVVIVGAGPAGLSAALGREVRGQPIAIYGHGANHTHFVIIAASGGAIAALAINTALLHEDSA